jgi:putative protein kinase ArgK-like GTPase of G3E family
LVTRGTIGVIASIPAACSPAGDFGDRIRMQELAGDPTSSYAAWPAAAAWRAGCSTRDAVRALDAAGSTSIIETVGAGQAEVETYARRRRSSW